MALVSYFNVAQRTHSMASFSAEYWHVLDVRLSAVLAAEKVDRTRVSVCIPVQSRGLPSSRFGIFLESLRLERQATLRMWLLRLFEPSSLAYEFSAGISGASFLPCDCYRSRGADLLLLPCRQ